MKASVFYTKWFILWIFLSTSCKQKALGQKETSPTQIAYFLEEVESIRKALSVPGMTLGIMQGDSLVWQKALGQANITRSEPMTVGHLFPLASISKTMASVLVMQLVEQGKLQLNASVRTYLPDEDIPSSVKIYHLLSHTSEGVPQTFFEYSARYGLLSDVVEKITKKKYFEVMESNILTPLKMQHSIPGVGAKGYETLSAQIAKPYRLGSKGKIMLGTLPSAGLRSSSGMVSCIGDLAKYARAIYQDQLLKPDTKQKMWKAMHTIEGDTLPYGLGWFIGNTEGKKIIWHYGQEACFSTVLMYIPEKNLTFIMLANSAALSEHGRMLNGNPARSALFCAFFKHFVWDKSTQNMELPAWDAPIKQWEDSLRGYADVHKKQAKEVLLSRFMLQSYLSKYQPSYQQASVQTWMLLARYFSADLEQLADAQLLFPLIELIQQEEYSLIPITEIIIENTKEGMRSPYIQYLVGKFYYLLHEENRALPYFKAVADMPNFRFRWYQPLATYYTGEILDNQHSPKAAIYLRRVINWGWNEDDVVVKARQRLK